MEIIIHRINKIKKLKKIPKRFGIEIDIRSYGSNLILNHDPYEKGDKLIDFLENYQNKTLVLNIKESGIEDDVLFLMNKFKIKSYFLLDIEMPYFYNSVVNKNKNIAVRFSEYEDIINAKYFINKAKWIWIDTVTKLPINKKNLGVINKFKSCLVCPERWGRENDIINYYNKLLKINFMPDSIMTSNKYSNIWEKLLNQKK